MDETPEPIRRLVAEALGAALLLAIVIGSGIMGERLAGGNVAIALLGNTLATGAGLVVLITIFGPLSGAHFNPAVTLVFVMRREIGWGLRPAIWRLSSPARYWASGPRTRCSPSPFRRFRTSCVTVPPSLFRVHRYFRAGRNHPWIGQVPPRSDPVYGRPLHLRRLLVHRLDLVRQPGGDHRPYNEQHLCRHRARIRAGVHRGANPGGVSSPGSSQLVASANIATGRVTKMHCLTINQTRDGRGSSLPAT